jgi:hypothetical protein
MASPLDLIDIGRQELQPYGVELRLVGVTAAVWSTITTASRSQTAPGKRPDTC